MDASLGTADRIGVLADALSRLELDGLDVPITARDAIDAARRGRSGAVAARLDVDATPVSLFGGAPPAPDRVIPGPGLARARPRRT
jgi:hypothetical protein